MGTKSNRSSGTQHNPRGVTQGNTLVDPNTGFPIDVIEDNNGKKRLAVDANITAQNIQVGVELDYQEDSVHIGDPNTDTIMKVNSDGSIDSNVEIDASDGDNIAIHDSDGDELEIHSDGSISTKTEIDTNGETVHINGTATTSPQSIPSISGNIITSFMLKNTNSSNVNIRISFDGGVSYFEIERGEVFYGEPKGNITQFIVSTGSSTATFQSIINRKA